MSNEEAKVILAAMQAFYTGTNGEPISDGYTALAMAIEALNQTGGADDGQNNNL